MAESGYGLAGLGMGKVKSVNPYRLTPGFGGFTPVSYATTECAFYAADAAYPSLMCIQIRVRIHRNSAILSTIALLESSADCLF